jgi:mannitol/fructose-specific phosphotransferase system IIA component (Ntr-type)
LVGDPLRMAIRLSKFLDPARISLALQATARAAALAEAAGLLAGHPDVVSFDGFYQELLARDRLETTNLANGVALPHARTEFVRNIVVAVGRSDAGIRYDDSPPPVRLLFVLGTPKSNPSDYLALVGSLCRLIKDTAHRDALLAAPSPEAFVATVVDLENKILGAVK